MLSLKVTLEYPAAMLTLTSAEDRARTLVYVSGPYSAPVGAAYQRAINVARAEAVQVELMRKGFSVVCPHKNTDGFEVYPEFTHEDYLRMDLVIMERCNAVCLLPQWQESAGARLEEQKAREWGMHIIRAKLIEERNVQPT